METTIVYRGYIRITENNMEAAIQGLGFRLRARGLRICSGVNVMIVIYFCGHAEFHHLDIISIRHSA